MSATTAKQQWSLLPSPRLYLALLLLTLSHLVSSNPQSDQTRLRFIEEPESKITGIDGKRIIFKCSASPTEAKIKWLRNGDLIKDKDFDWISTGKNKLIVKVENSFLAKNNSQDESFQCLADLNGMVLVSQPAKLIIAELATFDPQDNITITVVAGNTAVIPCNLPRGFPYVFSEFQYKNLSISRSMDRYRLVPSGALHILTVKPDDSGNYQCIAHNPFLEESVKPNHFVTLKVVKQKKANGKFQHLKELHFVVAPKEKTQSVLGQNITIECVANGHPVPRIKWLKREPNGDEGGLPPNRAYVDSGNLYLTTLEKNDEGDYVCRASNPKTGKSIESVTNLEISEMPQILNTKNANDEDKDYEVLEVDEGQNLELKCETRGYPKPHITWLHNGFMVMDSKDSRSYQLSNDGTTLTIVDAKPDTLGGFYQCFATNTLGATYSTKLVNVRRANDRPGNGRGKQKGGHHNHSGTGNGGNSGVGKQKQTFSTEYKTPGDAYNFPEPSVDDVIGNPITDEEEEEEEFEDGQRPKKQKNKKDRNRKENFIKPTKPIVSRLSDNSVMIRWSLHQKNSSHDSESPMKISFFKVQWKELVKGSPWQTIEDDIPPHIFTYSIAQLNSQVSYRFRIAAVYANNADHHSLTSDKFSFPKGLSKRLDILPTIIGGEAVSSTEIAIKWDFFHMNDIPIDGFIIQYHSASSAGQPTKVTAPGADTKKMTIDHLNPGVMYDFTVQAFNSEGISDPSNTYKITTKDAQKTIDEPPITETPINILNPNIETGPVPNGGVDDLMTRLPKEIQQWFTQSNQWQLLVVFIVFCALILVFLACCLSFIIRTKSGSKKMKKAQGSHNSKTPPTLPGDFYFNNSSVGNVGPNSGPTSGFERTRAQSSHHLAQSTTSLSRSPYKAPSMMHPSMVDMTGEPRGMMPEMRPLNGHASMMRLPRQHDIDGLDGAMSTLNRKNNSFRKSMSISAHHLAYQHQQLIQKTTYDYQQDSAGHSGSHPSASDSDDGSLSNSNQNHHLGPHHLSQHHLSQHHLSQNHLYNQGGHHTMQSMHSQNAHPQAGHFMSTMERKRAMQRRQESYMQDDVNSYTLSKHSHPAKHSATRHNGTLERKRRSRGDLSTIDRNAYLRSGAGDYPQNNQNNAGHQAYLQNNLQNVIMQSSC